LPVLTTALTVTSSALMAPRWVRTCNTSRLPGFSDSRRATRWLTATCAASGEGRSPSTFQVLRGNTCGSETGSYPMPTTRKESAPVAAMGANRVRGVQATLSRSISARNSGVTVSRRSIGCWPIWVG
jgi:hypothetical protein